MFFFCCTQIAYGMENSWLCATTTKGLVTRLLLITSSDKIERCEGRRCQMALSLCVVSWRKPLGCNGAHQVHHQNLSSAFAVLPSQTAYWLPHAAHNRGPAAWQNQPRQRFVSVSVTSIVSCCLHIFGPSSHSAWLESINLISSKHSAQHTAQRDRETDTISFISILNFQCDRNRWVCAKLIRCSNDTRRNEFFLILMFCSLSMPRSQLMASTIARIKIKWMKSLVNLAHFMLNEHPSHGHNRPIQWNQLPHDK